MRERRDIPMEKYDRGEIVDQDVPMPFPEEVVGQDVPVVKVQAGSKIRNLLNFALPTIKDKPQIYIVGFGAAVSKVITIAEMLKRKERGLDQWNKIGYKHVLEYWEPNEEGLFRLQAKREIPVMHILLSRTPLDASLPGVQKAIAKQPRPQTQHKDRRPRQKANKNEDSAAKSDNAASQAGDTGDDPMDDTTRGTTTRTSKKVRPRTGHKRQTASGFSSAM